MPLGACGTKRLAHETLSRLPSSHCGIAKLTKEVALTKARTEYTKKQAEVTTLLSDRKNRPVGAAIEKVLSSGGVDRQLHHGNTVNGGHITSFLLNYIFLLTSTRAILQEANLKLKNPSRTPAQINAYIDGLMVLCATFDAICELASTTSQRLSDAQCDQFERLCKLFGAQWRLVMTSRPVKLHLLESHLWVQMRELRNLAFCEEGGIERLHHWYKEKLRIFANMRNWVSKTSAIIHRFNKEKCAAVQQVVEQVAGATKRRWSGQTSSKLAEAAEKKVEEKKIKIEKASKLTSGR